LRLPYCVEKASKLIKIDYIPKVYTKLRYCFNMKAKI